MLLGLMLLLALAAGGGRALTGRSAQAVGQSSGQSAGQSGAMPQLRGMSGEPLPALQGEAARAPLSEQGLSAGVQQAYQKARYGVHPNVQADGGYFANNPAQGYQAGFGSRGLHLQGGAESGGDWGWNWRAWGKARGNWR